MDQNNIQQDFVEVALKPKASIWFGAESTKWRVLDVDPENQKALLIAEREICEKAYHECPVPVTWIDCSLREWLNGKYFKQSFTKDEQEAIITSRLENRPYTESETNATNITEDKLFLLSCDEIKKYKNVLLEETDNEWWLRTPEMDSAYARCVSRFGNEFSYSVEYKCGVRPAAWVDLRSNCFLPYIKWDPGESPIIRVPKIHIWKDSVVGADQDLKIADIPKGVTQLGARCFENHIKLEEVRLPPTLKKIGPKVFDGCKNLILISGTNGDIIWDKNAISSMHETKYIPKSEIFCNAGRLCDAFIWYFEWSKIGTEEEIAWVQLYQDGRRWEDAVARRVNAENANHVLCRIIAILRERSGKEEKTAEKACLFARKYVTYLSKESVQTLIDSLREKNLDSTIKSLMEDPGISMLIDDDNEKSAGRLTSDGYYWYGEITERLTHGARFRMGVDGLMWKVLHIDELGETALVITENTLWLDYDWKPPERALSSEYTWNKCPLRKKLNEMFYDRTFSDLEKAAILESNLENLDNPQCNVKGGGNTVDRIFLLSIEEAERFFTDNADRATGNEWWLRTPTKVLLTHVGWDGSIWNYGYGNSYRYVRPAMWISLKSDYTASIISNKDHELYISRPKLLIKGGAVTEADKDLEEVELPNYVKKIAAKAFQNCLHLKTITWDGEQPEIDEEAFINCPELRLPSDFFDGKKLPKRNFAAYLPDEPRALSNVLLRAQKSSPFYSVLTERIHTDNAIPIADELLLRLNAGSKVREPEYLARFLLATAPVIGKFRFEKIKELIRDMLIPNIAENILAIEGIPEWELGESTVSGYAFHLSDEILIKELPTEKPSIPIAWVLAAAGEYAGMYSSNVDSAGNHLIIEPKEYRKAALNAYKLSDNANRLAKTANHEALMAILQFWAETVEPRWYAPYAAFANDKEFAVLIEKIKYWEKDKSLREQIIRVRGAVLLNDSVTAMRYVDSLGLLDRYAEMRGMDSDDIRDNTISDFGLNSDGTKKWILARNELTASLNPDFTISLLDSDGKVLKSVPKKNAAPEEYDAVNKEFTAMKKAIKLTAKTRNEKIFADFLSGRTRPGIDWKKAYLGNPLLRMLARLIIWEQNSTSFILDEDGNAHDVFGNEYKITNDPIVVAHPMEMGAGTTEAWQKYFSVKGLKQPFEQVWEPVTDGAMVKPGRYDGCTIPLYMLMNKEKHGIIMKGDSEISLTGCSAELKYIEGHHDWYNNEFEIKDFRFDKYNRQVNHIVVHLDKGTVAGRIKKDDISVAQWFDRFTLAQITDFIKLAQENNAVNVLAQLMEYKNSHYAGFDPMDEFTLDLI